MRSPSAGRREESVSAPLRGSLLFASSASRLGARVAAAVALLVAAALPLGATSVIPVSDAELYRRADVVVHGVVLSNAAGADASGRPETVTVIQPLEVLKGRLRGRLVIHQTGGRLPDGRFLQLWGRPEYTSGREVIVFAIARPRGDFQTAEMLLGKFEIWQDARSRRFAVPDAALAAHAGVGFYASVADLVAGRTSAARPSAPRELTGFVEHLRRGSFPATPDVPAAGALTPVRHTVAEAARPLWGNINNLLYRWNNGATAVWTFTGTANITGGGTAEATNALATWTTYPNSSIHYTAGTGTSNVIYLNATSSSLGCGWSTCLSGSGVIGCGGPGGGGSNTWRGDTYSTITGGTVELRSYCTTNLYSSVVTQSVLEHELGHTLGLGHSDQNVSAHDVCRGDEDAAIMRSVVQSYTALGTDDQDAVRWIYGDGANSCGSVGTPTAAPTPTPTRTPTATATPTWTATRTPSSTATATFTPSRTPTSTRTPTATPTPTTSLTPPPTGTATPTSTSTPTFTATPTPTTGVAPTLPPTRTPTPPSAGWQYFSMTPCRAVDTRSAAGPYGGPALAAGADRSFVLINRCGIPPGARAVAVNLTVTESTASGYLVLYSGGTAVPVASTVNYRAGQTRANNAFVTLGAGGDVALHCGQASGTVQAVIDVNGYFQ